MKKTLALFSCAAILAVLSGGALISAENGQMAGKATVRAAVGDVSYQSNGGELHKLHVNQTLEPGATVVTGPDSHCDLSVNGLSSVVRINPDSKIELSKMIAYGMSMSSDRETYLHLESGAILGTVKKVSGNSRYEIETPHGVAGIRGTDFQITITSRPDGTYAVTFSSVQGQVIVAAEISGQTVTHILNTGQSWTPGEGDVVATEPATQDQALNIVNILNTETPGLNLTLPPTPGPQSPFSTGGTPNGNEGSGSLPTP